jgi:hypothetical protein
MKSHTITNTKKLAALQEGINQIEMRAAQLKAVKRDFCAGVRWIEGGSIGDSPKWGGSAAGACALLDRSGANPMGSIGNVIGLIGP